MNVQDETVVTTIQLIIDNFIKNGGNLKATGRIVGTLLFEHSSTYSGMTSEAALVDKFLNGKSWSKDHLWPRQYTGERLLHEFSQIGHVDRQVLADKIKAYTVVNRVTKKENDLLKEFQKRDTFISPEHAYEQVGIVLRDWPNGQKITLLPEIYPHLKPFLQKVIPQQILGKI